MNLLSKRLIEAGFTEYEAKAYSTLLSQNLVTASELSKLAQIPQQRIYSILNNLVDKGFCSIYAGTIKKYKAENPESAFIEMIQQREKAVEDLHQLQADLKEEYENKNENNDNPLEFIQILTSKQSQVNKFDELIRRSTKTLYSFNKKPYATGFERDLESIKKDSAPLIKILNQGTSVKALFEKEELNNTAFIKMVSFYDSIGEEVRISEALPLKMLISDSEIAMASMRNNDASKFKVTSMIIDHSDLTSALAQLFEMHWEKADTLQKYIEKNNIIL